MKTYKVTQVVEMMVSHTVRARNADEANEIASERTGNLCVSLSRTRSNISFGDIQEDYVPATDDDFGTKPVKPTDSDIYGEVVK